MKIIDNIDEINSILFTYNGGRAKVFFFAVSRNRLAVKVYFPRRALVLYVVAEACERICGNFAWHNTHLSLSLALDEAGPNYKLVDEISRFELIASSGIVVAVGEEHEFGDSLDSLLRP